MSSADLERQKYEAVWTFQNYRQRSPGEFCVERAIASLGMQEGDTVIDYGCGTGRAAQKFAGLGMDVTGVDIAKNCLDDKVTIPLVVACLWDLPGIWSKWAFSADVMEHLPEDHVEEVFDGIASRCTGAFFQICTSKDGFGERLIGEPLHLTVKPGDWWTDQARTHWSEVVAVTSRSHVELVCR